MTYRFLGTQTLILGPNPQRLTKFGQQFELTEAQLPNVLHERGITAIPDAAFCEIFPEGKVDSKAKDFAEQKKRALTVLHELRANAVVGQASPPVDPEQNVPEQKEAI
jgi:hypothetical protein